MTMFITVRPPIAPQTAVEIEALARLARTRPRITSRITSLTPNFALSGSGSAGSGVDRVGEAHQRDPGDELCQHPMEHRHVDDFGLVLHLHQEAAEQRRQPDEVQHQQGLREQPMRRPYRRQVLPTKAPIRSASDTIASEPNVW